MKSLVLLLALAFSSQVFARQYMQCADEHTWNRAVINLDGENSTFFLTNGVHLPDERRLLKKITFEEEVDDLHIYRIEDKNNEVKIEIPSDVIGTFNNNFTIILRGKKNNSKYSYVSEMRCFSAIYDS